MKELNAEQIIKALECCQKRRCQSCTYDVFGNPLSNCRVKKHALALIKELLQERDALKNHNAYLKGVIVHAFGKELQDFDDKSAAKACAEAEMWRIITLEHKKLTEENEKLGADNFELVCKLSRMREDSAREFAEMLKQEFRNDGRSNWYIRRVIDKVLKKMLEGGADDA